MPVGASLRLNWPRQLARGFEGWTCLRSDIPTRFCSFSYLGLIGLSFTLWVECLTLACSGPSLCSQSMLQNFLPPMYSCGSGKSTEGHQQLFHKADDAVPPTDFWSTWYHQAVLPGPWATNFPYYWWTGRPAEGHRQWTGRKRGTPWSGVGFLSWIAARSINVLAWFQDRMMASHASGLRVVIHSSDLQAGRVPDGRSILYVEMVASTRPVPRHAQSYARWSTK